MRKKIHLMMAFTGLVSLSLYSGGKKDIAGLEGQDVKTVALWLFDEPAALYPSHVLDDQSDNDYPLVLGLGGRLTGGKFGNALSTEMHAKIVLPEGEEHFGLVNMKPVDGRSIAPLTWYNAQFCALMTAGETHLRKEVGFVNPTKSKLNLGDFDWTVEFWMKTDPDPAKGSGVIFEIGAGPRVDNPEVTRLEYDARNAVFTLINTPSGTEVRLPGDKMEQDGTDWVHCVFTYQAGTRKITHYLNGREASSAGASLISLPEGEEAYLSLGRDGAWEKPLQGLLDELRFSEGVVYQGDFKVPGSLGPIRPNVTSDDLLAGPPLLFGEGEKYPLPLNDRRFLFIDDALFNESKDITFNVNPPRPAEKVIDHIEGPFRKHLTVVEDESGLIRLYNSIHDDYLAVRTSKDGIHFEVPDLGSSYRGQVNIVNREPTGGMGNPFIDPNAPEDEKWRYITGYHNRGIYLYTSPDGYNWTRIRTAHIPFRSGTQSCTFYDDQRQLYVGYHRSGMGLTPGGATQRQSSLTETTDLYHPIPYKPVSQEETWEASKTMHLRQPQPWWLDNGPLTPGGFGIEYPAKFLPDENDLPGVDQYVTKATKYEYAPDVYVAFPIVYFHYEMDGPFTRQILMDPARQRGSGPIETQIAVSRDGVNWKRYYRPAYVGNGKHGEWTVNQAYLAHGMVRRGDEIWQYYFGTGFYHSTYDKTRDQQAVFRVVQRLDGFISADAPYDREGYFITKPFVFKGNRLVLNIDTDAAGYARVGFLDEAGEPIGGFGPDQCIYINGDFIDTEVEWLLNGSELEDIEIHSEEDYMKLAAMTRTNKDVSKLEGKTVRMVVFMRGAKLYSMQFIDK
ncbi:MAG: LamG-like jellyroll fold domain-containing protein [Bacteroidales bacterium]